MKTTERQFVEQLRRTARQHGSRGGSGLALKQGIGDDCAVLSGTSRNDVLVTTDLFLEGIHFRRKWQHADSVGHKVLTRGLSDIASMGGIPRYTFLSLALPAGTTSIWVDQFFQGLFRLAEASGVTLAGGDTARSCSGFIADIIVVGEVPRGTAVLRSGARPGDEIWVTGALGGAALALELLRKGFSREAKKIANRTELLKPFLYPQARLAIGRLLRARGVASAMIDLSDGLSIDLARLCQASGVGARIDGESVPRHPHSSLAHTPLAQALHGGEDFELLFTVPKNGSNRVPRRVGGVPLTRIGEIVGGRQLRMLRQGREESLPVLGFQHF